jgi:hypothetical protein
MGDRFNMVDLRVVIGCILQDTLHKEMTPRNWTLDMGGVPGGSLTPPYRVNDITIIFP